MFRPICYWVIFVVLNVWHNMQNISEELWKHFLSSSELVWAGFYCFYLNALWAVTFISVTFFLASLYEWIYWRVGQACQSLHLLMFLFWNRGYKKNGMERFDFFTLLSILLLATCQGLRKTLFIYFFCNFNFFVSVLKYILTRRYIVIRIFL